MRVKHQRNAISEVTDLPFIFRIRFEITDRLFELARLHKQGAKLIDFFGAGLGDTFAQCVNDRQTTTVKLRVAVDNHRGPCVRKKSDGGRRTSEGGTDALNGGSRPGPPAKHKFLTSRKNRATGPRPARA